MKAKMAEGGMMKDWTHTYGENEAAYGRLHEDDGKPEWMSKGTE